LKDEAEGGEIDVYDAKPKYKYVLVDFMTEGG